MKDDETRAEYAQRLIAQQASRLDAVERAIGPTLGSLLEASEVLPEAISRGLVIERTALGNLAEREDGHGFIVRETTENEENGIPASFEVKVLGPHDKAGDRVTCGTCGLSWDDAVVTSMTPAPSGRCPFEWYHIEEPEEGDEPEPERWEVAVKRAAEALTTALGGVPEGVMHYAVEQVRGPIRVLAREMGKRIEAGVRVPAVRIWLHRVEGLSAECTEHTFEGPDVWRQAREQLVTWSGTAPDGGSYDKTDFKVTYEGGQEYSGTFGLKRHDVDLPNHMRGHLQHLLAHPGVYAKFVDEARTLLDQYEIGPNV